MWLLMLLVRPIYVVWRIRYQMTSSYFVYFLFIKIWHSPLARRIVCPTLKTQIHGVEHTHTLTPRSLTHCSLDNRGKYDDDNWNVHQKITQCQIWTKKNCSRAHPHSEIFGTKVCLIILTNNLLQTFTSRIPYSVCTFLWEIWNILVVILQTRGV